MYTTLTYRYRIKDSSTIALLQVLSSQTNFVWNYCNDVIRRRWKESRRFTNKCDLHALTKGASSELDLNSQTVQNIYEELVAKVTKHKKSIRFRTRKRNLGWIPFKGQTFKFYGNYCVYNSQKFRLWYHRRLPLGAEVKTGCFSETSEGKWFLNLVVKFKEFLPPAPKVATGLDLGLKTVVTSAHGNKFDRENLTKKYASKLAKSQRHRKKRQVKKINAKIKNSRLDFNHKTSHSLTKRYGKIFCGDVASSKLATTRFAKSVYDASWCQLKTFLSYKSIRRQGMFQEVSEYNSTRTCSSCTCLTGPQGIGALGVREWLCASCNTVHDRDINSALNHLRLGHETLNAAKAA